MFSSAFGRKTVGYKLLNRIWIVLKQRGYSVSCIKCENYLNIDSGTINPIEHGDPFLSEDVLESDMDLGTYERFLEEEMGSKNCTTMGQIYKSVIDRERSMGYEGEDVEAIPHVVDEIIARIEKIDKTPDATYVSAYKVVLLLDNNNFGQVVKVEFKDE